MGGSSVPSSTSQYQQLATGIWGSPQATKLALPILKPALANIKEQQEMLLGFQKGDPTQTRKFFGLPTDAPPEEITRSIASRTRGPQIQMPQVQAAQQAPQQPIKTAAQGGIMALGDMPQRDPRRGFAPGGSTVRSLNPQQRQAVLNINRIISSGGTPTDAQKARLDKIEKNTGLNVSPFSDTGTGVPKNPTVAKAVSTAATAFQATPEGRAPAEIQAAAAQAGLAPANAYLGQAGSFGTSIEKVRDPVTGEMVDKFNVTNPYYNQAINTLQGMNTQPAQFGQATQAYNDAIAGLNKAAETGYSTINAADLKGTAAQMGSYEQVAAKKAETEDAIAAAMKRGDVRNVAALKADVEKYNAALMNAPKEAEVKDYQAAQMKAAEMQRARDVNAPTAQAYTYGASQMGAPADIRAGDYTAAQAKAAQMAQAKDVTGQTYNAARIGPTAREQGVTTAAPKSWTDAGVSSQYMSPYMQNVVDIQKREANRDYLKQLNQLKSQAVGAKAYGGSRLAIEQSEAARNQAQRLGDIEAQGLQQAYQSGMGQFSAEQGLGSQVGMSNTAQINQLKSQYMQMGMTEAQANQAAVNQARQFSAQSAQQAALANQQAGLTTGQTNLSALQQTAMANMQAINQQRQTAVNNALQAAMTSYGGKLTAAQQNMIADNAAKQFNAQNQTQISQANAQMNLASQQSNQAADLTTNQANAQFQQQAAAANQAATNQQRQNYVNNTLQAAMQAYSGQLTAAQQNQIAQNAAMQFNAQSQNAANNAFAAQSLQANLANQQMDFGVGQLNTQNQQAANMYNAQAQNQANAQFATQDLAAQQANQQAGLTTAQQNAQLAQQMALANQQVGLTAAQANQQAGLTANQQAIGAYGQAAGAAQGLGSLGTQVGGYNANLANLWGQAGGVLQGLGQAAYGQQQQNAANIFGGPTTLGNQGMSLLGGMGGGQQGVVNQAGRQG